MTPKLAKIIAELDAEYQLLDDYLAPENCVPTYAIIVPSLAHLIQTLIEYSESFNTVTRIGQFKIKKHNFNYLIY